MVGLNVAPEIVEQRRADLIEAVAGAAFHADLAIVQPVRIEGLLGSGGSRDAARVEAARPIALGIERIDHIFRRDFALKRNLRCPSPILRLLLHAAHAGRGGGDGRAHAELRIEQTDSGPGQPAAAEVIDQFAIGCCFRQVIGTAHLIAQQQGGGCAGPMRTELSIALFLGPGGVETGQPLKRSAIRRGGDQVLDQKIARGFLVENADILAVVVVEQRERRRGVIAVRIAVMDIAGR